ncbi:MAG: hypothetical protein Q8O91_07050 [Candidatus Aminicenantes bacterium]|nr:hypothetical protein [Candidatus Aminicenantes bacterium]
MRKKPRLALSLGAAVLVFGGHDPFLGLNAGFVALAVNAVVAVGLSLFLSRRRRSDGVSLPSKRTQFVDVDGERTCGMT